VACNKTRKGVFIFSSLYLSLSLYDDKFYFQFGGQEEPKKKNSNVNAFKKRRGGNCRRALQVESSLLCVGGIYRLTHWASR
jgi:hypothetical protein